MHASDGSLFREVAALGRAARAELGALDVRRARRLARSTQLAELIGRIALHLAAGPWLWLVGTLSLAYYYAVSAQLNHSIMHGAYVGLPGAGRLVPQQHETLALPFRARTWGDAHWIHHGHPSVYEADPDTVHPLTRVHRDMPWRPWHLLNLVVGSVFTFECWAFDYDRFLKRSGRRAPDDRGERAKFSAFVAYNYLLFPLIAGANAPQVFFGTLAASVIRNLVFIALQSGSSVGRHVSRAHDRGLARAPDRTDGPHPRDAWIRFQIETSKNFVLRSRLWRRLYGGLDRHIEHHLFPRLPPERLHALAPRVRALCVRHGIRYEEHPSLQASLRDSAAHLVQLSRPDPRQ